MSAAPAVPASFSACKDNKERFIHAFEIIKEYLVADAVANMALAGNRKEYVKKMLDVTCLGGKYNRGITVVDVVDILSKDLTGEAKERLLFEGCVCGWMIEMLQAHFLVEDDIMDDSKTRRGKPCWYLFPGVTTQSAINDGLIVLAMASEIAFHYIGYKPAALMSILREFHRTDYRTTIGQLYDVTSMRNDADIDAEKTQHATTDFSEYTMDSFKRIVKYKTAYYTYHLPLVMGLAVCGHLTAATEGVCPADTERIAMVMGEYFQAQDDFMDCYTDPAILLKIGTDIEDMKCSWLAANFVMSATPAQMEVFKANYGKHAPESVAAVKALYNEADMKSKFEAYEATIAAEVETLLAKMKGSNAAFAEACQNLWDKTYKRSK